MKRLSLFFTLLMATFISSSSLLLSTELMPWNDTDLLVYPRFEYFYQHFDKIKSSSGTRHRNTNDHFYTAGISGSYELWSLDGELTAATTPQRDFGFDSLKITAQYLLKNDILGDPVSLMVGLTYAVSIKSAIHNIGAFHHGNNELKGHVSLGKERTSGDSWTSRWWTVAEFGIADRGQPWFEFIGAWEKNVSPTLIFRIYGRGLCGLGKHAIHFHHHFHGYGSIKHRSVDIGVRLTKQTDCGGIWYAEYVQRVFAYNFPEGANQFKLCFIYPFVYPFPYKCDF